MSKDYRYADEVGDWLSIKPSTTTKNTALVTTHSLAVAVPQDEAAVAALALLTASGVTPRGGGQRIEHAAHLLRAAIDEAALDEEALALMNAGTEAHWTEFPNETVAECWRRAARKAREIHTP